MMTNLIVEDITNTIEMCKFILENHTFSLDDQYSYKIEVKKSDLNLDFLEIYLKKNNEYLIAFFCDEKFLSLKKGEDIDSKTKSSMSYIRDSILLKESYDLIIKQYRQIARRYKIENFLKENEKI